MLKGNYGSRSFPNRSGYSYSDEEIHPGHKHFEDIWDLWHHHFKATANHKRYVDKDITHFTVENFKDTYTGGFWPSRFCVHYTDSSTGTRCKGPVGPSAGMTAWITSSMPRPQRKAAGPGQWHPRLPWIWHRPTGRQEPLLLFGGTSRVLTSTRRLTATTSN